MTRHSVHPGRLRTLLAAGAALVVLALAPGAHAATVSEVSGKLSYVAATGEANHVTIAPWGFSFKVTDSGTEHGAPIALNVGAGCIRLSSSSASCGLLVSSIAFDGGDGDDFLDTSASALPVAANGGAGNDTITTGSGNDRINGGGGADTISCGGGSDSGSADAVATVAGDCEAITRPDAPPDPTEPGSVPPTTPPSNAVPPTIPPQTVGISASGVATVLVTCPADSGGCSGVVTITLPAASNRRHAKAVAARKSTGVKVGSAKFKAAAGSSKSVPVRLSKRGRQRILRGRSRRARITVTTRSAAGTRVVTTQDVTLRLRPKAKSANRARRKAGHR